VCYLEVVVVHVFLVFFLERMRYADLSQTVDQIVLMIASDVVLGVEFFGNGKLWKS